MIEVRQPGQPLLFQIYLDRNRANSLKLIQKIESMGFDGIMFTVGEQISLFLLQKHQPGLTVLGLDQTRLPRASVSSTCVPSP
jgi:hypothetical protein